MSQNNSNAKTAMLAKLDSIHKVEGFDPSPFAVDYTDLNTQETRKRLPVMIQMAWFRLKYPEGRIAIQVSPGKDCFVATARIYPSYKDPVDCYLAEATASRGPDASKPSVSPREWAQTAAVGIALRNAGFGLQFSAAGDDFADDLRNVDFAHQQAKGFGGEDDDGQIQEKFDIQRGCALFLSYGLFIHKFFIFYGKPRIGENQGENPTNFGHRSAPFLAVLLFRLCCPDGWPAVRCRFFVPAPTACGIPTWSSASPSERIWRGSARWRTPPGPRFPSSAVR